MLAGVSRGISLVGLSFKNVLYFLLFAAVILFLFFIPEILKFNWSKFFGFDVKRQAIQQVQVIKSPLDDLIQRINAGQYSAKARPVTNEIKEVKPELQPFNPKLKLSGLEIIKIQNQASAIARPRTILQMYGSFYGKDIKRVGLFRNGEFVKKIPFGRTDKQGKREFYIAQHDAYGKWTIYIEDKNNRVYTKTYQFFPRVERFPKIKDTYKLRKTIDGLDPKIEQYFTVSERVPGQKSSKAFVRF